MAPKGEPASSASSAPSVKGVPMRAYAPDESTSCSAPINFFGGASESLAPPPLLTDTKLTRQAIKDRLPARLFERSAFWGFVHLGWDLTMVGAAAYGASHISLVESEYARAALWALYWAFSGTVLTGVWVLAHECGHQSFSDSEWLNNTVGWVLHSALLVPFHSWRISHRNHHSNTCSIENDEVFVPSTRSDFSEMIADTPLYNAIEIFTMLTVGWPGYISANFSGPAKYRGSANSHFNPTGTLFTPAGKAVGTPVDPQTRWEVLVSDFGFFGAVAAIGAAGYHFGALNVLFYYFIPYLIVNLFLVLITYLQHTDVYIRHYRQGAFTWERGALSTVDRSYGWLLDSIFHHIADTHVVHHLFHTMPFYNAIEATKLIRSPDFLGPYYLRDDTPIPAALWRSWSKCRFVEDEGDIVFYKDAAALNEGLANPKKASSSGGKKRN